MRENPAKRLPFWTALLTLLLLGSAVSAQPGPRRSAGPPDGERMLERMTRLLDLSEEQVAEIGAILEAHRSVAEQHREARRAHREAMQEALDAASPDPTEVGELFLAGREQAQQAAADRELRQEQIDGVLTEEQQAKWEGFRRGRHGPRGGPGRGLRGPKGSAPPEVGSADAPRRHP